MSLVSRNKTNGTNVQVTPTVVHEDNGNALFDNDTVTPEMVLHMPTITDSKFITIYVYLFKKKNFFSFSFTCKPQ